MRRVIVALVLAALLTFAILAIAVPSVTEFVRGCKKVEVPSLTVPTPPPALKSGDKAPDFTLNDTEGVGFSLSDFRGKPVLLNFMATWCLPCRAEMKDLRELNRLYHPKGTVFISVDTDPTETDQMLKEWKSDYCADWLYARDTANLVALYRVNNIPLNYVIDKDGRVAYGEAGQANFEELSAILDSLLG